MLVPPALPKPMFELPLLARPRLWLPTLPLPTLPSPTLPSPTLRLPTLASPALNPLEVAELARDVVGLGGGAGVNVIDQPLFGLVGELLEFEDGDGFVELDALDDPDDVEEPVADELAWVDLLPLCPCEEPAAEDELESELCEADGDVAPTADFGPEAEWEDDFPTASPALSACATPELVMTADPTASAKNPAISQA